MCLNQRKHFKKTKIKLHNTLSHQTLLHGNENWTIKARDET